MGDHPDLFCLLVRWPNQFGEMLEGNGPAATIPEMVAAARESLVTDIE